jgi:hypothetical protein
MSINKFLEQENMQLLWEVLIDEPLIKELCNSDIKMNNLIHIFESNIKDFFSAEKNNCNNLMELNKKYILLIINYLIKINNANAASNPTNTQKTDNTLQYRKIKIHPEETIKESITYEDIHNDRMTLFEKELNKKQNEFTTAMALPIPPVPNFSDNPDQPFNEIELEIKRIQEQRNYDIEIIANTNNNNTNLSADQNWLKPQETSIKNEKLIVNPRKNDNSIKKHISWEDEHPQTYRHEDQDQHQEEINIFNKLKKITSDAHNNNNVSGGGGGTNFQLQIDEIKKDLLSLNEKMDLILQKI